jgi:hypothetical protein
MTGKFDTVLVYALLVLSFACVIKLSFDRNRHDREIEVLREEVRALKEAK